jgi:hypothetical protein
VASVAYFLSLPPTLNMADESFVLYGAKRILQGQALYRDFFDFVTPGSFYLYALAFEIAGVSITTARVVTALLNGLAVACTYFLAQRVAARAEAVIAALLVAVICVPVWNLASHHWIITALGLAAAAVLLAPGWSESSRGRPLAAGALVALAVCTHQQRGVWLMIWLGAAIPMLTWSRRDADRGRRGGGEMLWAALGGAAVCVPLLGAAVWQSSFAAMRYATETFVLSSYRSYHVGKMAWNGYNAAWADGVPYTLHWLFQALPALLLIEAAGLAVAAWRHDLRRQVLRAAVCLLAVCAALAIFYYPDVIHVAFVAPFSFVVIAGMVHRLRTRPGVRRIPAAPWLARLAFVALLAAIALKAQRNVDLAWKMNPVLFDTAFGTLAGWGDRADSLRDLRAALGAGADHPPPVFVYQSEAWLYLTLPADNPTPFAYLRPGYNTAAQIQDAIAALERAPAARVVVNAVMPLPGDPFMAYLTEHFRRVGGAGPLVRGEPMYQIYERNAAS